MPHSEKIVYLAGELFDSKHLIGNAALARSMVRNSEGRYRIALPQSLEQRETSASAIRNADLRELFRADAAVFHFDGNDADSGTVVEFCFAKMLDIPSVLVRSDFRNSGDNELVPWNLMLSSFPRSSVVLVPSLFRYQDFLHREKFDPCAADASEREFNAALQLIDDIAQRVCRTLDEVCALPSVLSSEDSQALGSILPRILGGDFEGCFSAEEICQQLERRLAN